MGKKIRIRRTTGRLEMKGLKKGEEVDYDKKRETRVWKVGGKAGAR